MLAITPASPTLIRPEHYPDWAYPYAFYQPIGVIWDLPSSTEIKIDNLPEAFPFNTDVHLQAIRWDNSD